jgi:hypothetical protein
MEQQKDADKRRFLASSLSLSFSSFHPLFLTPCNMGGKSKCRRCGTKLLGMTYCGGVIDDAFRVMVLGQNVTSYKRICYRCFVANKKPLDEQFPAGMLYTSHASTPEVDAWMCEQFGLRPSQQQAQAPPTPHVEPQTQQQLPPLLLPQAQQPPPQPPPQPQSASLSHAAPCELRKRKAGPTHGSAAASAAVFNAARTSPKHQRTSSSSLSVAALATSPAAPAADTEMVSEPAQTQPLSQLQQPQQKPDVLSPPTPLCSQAEAQQPAHEHPLAGEDAAMTLQMAETIPPQTLLPSSSQAETQQPAHEHPLAGEDAAMTHHSAEAATACAHVLQNGGGCSTDMEIDGSEPHADAAAEHAMFDANFGGTGVESLSKAGLANPDQPMHEQSQQARVGYPAKRSRKTVDTWGGGSHDGQLLRLQNSDMKHCFMNSILQAMRSVYRVNPGFSYASICAPGDVQLGRALDAVCGDQPHTSSIDAAHFITLQCAFTPRDVLLEADDPSAFLSKIFHAAVVNSPGNIFGVSKRWSSTCIDCGRIEQQPPAFAMMLLLGMGSGGPGTSSQRATRSSLRIATQSTTNNTQQKPSLPSKSFSISEMLNAEMTDTMNKRCSNQQCCPAGEMHPDGSIHRSIGQVQRWPHVLVLQIKREQWTQQQAPRRRASAAPCWVDMPEVLRHGSHKYELLAVVSRPTSARSNTDAHHGHWVAHVRDKQDWWLCDDASLKQHLRGFADVVEHSSCGCRLLFYQLVEQVASAASNQWAALRQPKWSSFTPLPWLGAAGWTIANHNQKLQDMVKFWAELPMGTNGREDEVLPQLGVRFDDKSAGNKIRLRNDGTQTTLAGLCAAAAKRDANLHAKMQQRVDADEQLIRELLQDLFADEQIVASLTLACSAFLAFAPGTLKQDLHMDLTPRELAEGCVVAIVYLTASQSTCFPQDSAMSDMLWHLELEDKLRPAAAIKRSEEHAQLIENQLPNMFSSQPVEPGAVSIFRGDTAHFGPANDSQQTRKALYFLFSPQSGCEQAKTQRYPLRVD